MQGSTMGDMFSFIIILALVFLLVSLAFDNGDTT